MQLRDINPGELEVLGEVSADEVAHLLQTIEERDVRLLYLDQAKVPAVALADALVERYSGKSGPPLFVHVREGSDLELQFHLYVVRDRVRIVVVPLKSSS